MWNPVFYEKKKKKKKKNYYQFAQRVVKVKIKDQITRSKEAWTVLHITLGHDKLNKTEFFASKGALLWKVAYLQWLKQFLTNCIPSRTAELNDLEATFFCGFSTKYLFSNLSSNYLCHQMKDNFYLPLDCLFNT